MSSIRSRFAILGCGNVATRHAQCLTDLEQTELVGVCDLRPERAQALGSQFGVELLDGIEALLQRNDIDAVSICVGTEAHASLAEQAMRAGKHVVLEKPIANDLPSARHLLDMRHALGTAFTVVSQHRFHDDIQWLRGVIETRALGRPILVSASSLWSRNQKYYESAPGRGLENVDEGGVLKNQAVHVIDLLLWLFGRANSVCGSKATLTHKIAVEDTATAVVSLTSGAMALLRASTSVGESCGEELEAWFEHGMVAISAGRVTRWKADPDARVSSPPSETNTAPVADRLLPLKRQYQDFVSAMTERCAPLVTAEQALHVLELIEATYQTCRSGQREPIGPPGSQEAT